MGYLFTSEPLSEGYPGKVSKAVGLLINTFDKSQILI